MVRALLLAFTCSLLGCEPKLVVGKRSAPDLGTAGNGGTAGSANATAGTVGTAGIAGLAGDAGEGGAGGEAGEGGEGGEAGAQCTDTGMAVPQTGPIAFPWATGFENAFCDYIDVDGFCFGTGTRKIVTSPVHS